MADANWTPEHAREFLDALREVCARFNVGLGACSCCTGMSAFVPPGPGEYVGDGWDGVSAVIHIEIKADEGHAILADTGDTIHVGING